MTDGEKTRALLPSVRNIKHAYKPVRFFLITFLLTWISWFISAYFSYQEGMSEYQLLFMFPGLFAPSVTALMMLSGPQNKELRADFWDRFRLNRIKLSFLPALFLLVPIVVILATVISLLFGLSVNQFALSSEYKVMRGHGLISLLILFLAPTFEEIGWRGYGVDSLRYKCNVFQTSLLFGVLWAMWHVPLFLCARHE
jgi:membrane protease YdiL (CAAX protease family)